MILKKILKVLGKICLIVIGVLFILLRSGSLYRDYTNSDTQLLKTLQNIDSSAQIKYYTNNGYTLRYVEMGNMSGDTVMLVYGTPGEILNRDTLLSTTDIIKKYHIIIPDRPGFGGSMDGHAMPMIKEQSDLLAALLPADKKSILVGWSYAGALLPYIAATHTELVKSMVIIAGTMDPLHQTIWLVTYPLHYTPLKWIIPNALRVTNTEKLSSENQLETMMPLRESIIAPTYLLHGTKDRIVDPQNSLFAQKMLKNAKVFYKSIPGIGHEIPIAMPDIVFDAIQTLEEYTSGK